MNETKYWLWLVMVFGVSNRRLWEVMTRFISPVDAFTELVSGRLDDKLNERELKNVKNTDIGAAEKYIAECSEKGIGVLSFGDNEYPVQLRHILNPPAILYYKGDISCLRGGRIVTCVGTRRPTDYSLQTCERICRTLAKCGLVIASGFAVGLDITAHLAAVSEHRPTICVMGCGLDVDYPRDNFGFREKIIKSGGVFISEYPLGTPPNSPNFPKRNRILAALGRVSVVFEASMRSGSLITAGLSADYGREVFCLPPADIYNSNFSGNISLLREGATPLYSPYDIVECFRIGGVLDAEIAEELASEGYSVSEFSVAAEEKKSRRKKNKKSEKIKETDTENSVSDTENAEENDVQSEDEEKYSEEELTELQKKIVQIISGKTVHADQIALELEIDASELISELTELEMLGVVRGLPGKLFEKA